MKTLAIAGTFDSKGEEFAYVRQVARSVGLNTFMIHTGVFPPAFEPDVSNESIAAAAGEDMKEIAARHDRAKATEVLSRGMKLLLPRLYAEKKFDGIISFGGSGGTSLITPAMQALPIGVPKIMVSTMASGNTQPYVGTSDIVMIPSVVDVSGLNVVSRKIFENAVYAAAGMLEHEHPAPKEDKPLVAATMFGVTTPCVQRAAAYLEERGYEVLVFHAVGSGGRTMERLIEQGYFAGVLDLTTTEWADELVGGILNAGPQRCEAAARCGVPQVMSVGAVDMVNFGPYDTVPAKFAGRNLYKHNPMITLMRTTKEENEAIGHKLAEKLNMAEVPSVLMLPLGGVSAIDSPGEPFYGVQEDEALFSTLRQEVTSPKVQIREFGCNINDPAFAEAAAEQLIRLMQQQKA